MWWDKDFFRSIHAWHDGELDEGRACCERLLSRPGLSEAIEENTRRNASWYAEVFPSVTLWSEDGSFNPSIAADPDGNLTMILRSANYTLQPGGYYYAFPPEDNGVIKTTNTVADVCIDSVNATVSNRQVVDDSAAVHRPSPFPVEGIEDLRLFWCGGDWWVTGTVRDRDEAGICSIMAAVLRDGALTDPRQISQGHSHDKNWMPVLGRGEIIDRVYPLTKRGLRPPRITCAVDAPYLARRFRGGGQVFWWPEQERWLGLVHESVTFPEDRQHWRAYTHRWLGWDALWRLASVSYPFCLEEKRSIEFAAGMVRQGDNVIVSYGRNDSSAHLIRVTLDDIASAWENRGRLTRDPVMSP